MSYCDSQIPVNRGPTKYNGIDYANVRTETLLLLIKSLHRYQLQFHFHLQNSAIQYRKFRGEDEYDSPAGQFSFTIIGFLYTSTSSRWSQRFQEAVIHATID